VDQDYSSGFAIELQNATKKFGDVVALDNITLAIKDNEFFTLLGPSGCGKTTLLRAIAGFDGLTSGSVHLYGEDIASLPPNHRPVNTVFQQYALFPHINVSENVMFGLRRLKRSETESKQRVAEVLDLVQLSEFAQRLPSQLSGGQQQRVALARALAPSPKVLLLDEPLSALDLKLRQAVRLELQQIQHETGITFIFVTHDQEEALTMSDRIAVLSEGRLQQIGSSRDIYESPQSKFVADFIGETNLIDVTVKSISSGKAVCELLSGQEITCPAAQEATVGPGSISIRPERISIDRGESPLLAGTVTRHVYLGTDLQVEVTLTNDETINLRMQNSDNIKVPETKQKIGVSFKEEAARLLVD